MNITRDSGTYPISVNPLLQGLFRRLLPGPRLSIDYPPPLCLGLQRPPKLRLDPPLFSLSSKLKDYASSVRQEHLLSTSSIWIISIPRSRPCSLPPLSIYHPSSHEVTSSPSLSSLPDPSYCPLSPQPSLPLSSGRY